MSDQMQAPQEDEVPRLKGQVKGLTAELNACKQILNESMQANMVSKTNLNLYADAHAEIGKANQNLIAHVQNLLVKIDKLEVQVADDARVILQLREALGQVPAPAEPASECDGA